MFSSSAKNRPDSASHSTPFSLSFTQMSKMHSYSALTDPHCVMTRSKGFRSHFAKVVGPYSLAASLSVKPNLDLDYSKRSVRERVRPMTANLALVGETAPSTRKRAPDTSTHTYKPYHKQGGGVGKPLDVPLSPEDVSDFRNPSSRQVRPKSAHFRRIDPTSPMGSPVTDMKTLRSKPSPFESALKQDRIKRRTLQLYLSGRRALLGEYRISPGETLSDLRDFVQANLEYYWSKSFTFAYRDGVEISNSHERRINLSDFIKNDETRCGVVIAPVHTRRTKRRQSVQERKKTIRASHSRVAKKFNEAKSFEAHEAAFGKDLQDAKSVVTDYDEKHPEHLTNLRDRANTMKKYEEVKERIAVSYLANVERNRTDARTELIKIMNIAALKIQNMYRCSKAKSFVEDVLLQLHAASVLQGIVRRGQSSAVAARKKKERDDLKAGVRQKALEESQKREKAHNRLHNARNPMRRDKPVHVSGLRTRFALSGIKTSKNLVKVEKKNAIVSIFVSHLAVSESCYRVRVTDPRVGLDVESEVEFKGEGFDNVRIGLDKQVDDEYFARACERIVVVLSENSDDEKSHKVIFDGDDFYQRILLHSEAIRIRRKEKYVIDIHQEQGTITVSCTCSRTGNLEHKLISPRHQEIIRHEAEEGAPKLVSDVSKREIFALKVMSHVYINEDGEMTVDFDLKVKEVVLFTACKKLDGVNSHVKISRVGDELKVLVLDPAYSSPFTTVVVDWKTTGKPSSFDEMSQDDIQELCMLIVQRITFKPGEGAGTTPTMIVDLAGIEKPVRIVTEAMHLLGQKFIVNCFRLGPSLMLDATGLKEATKYNLEVDESDWENTGYGPLDKMHGAMGKKELKIVELCRRILENTYMQKTSTGVMQLSLDLNMLHRKCLYRGGLYVGDFNYRVYVFDSSMQKNNESVQGPGKLSINRQSLARVSGTVLQVRAENLESEERLNLDVPHSEWKLGIRNKASKERVASLSEDHKLDFHSFEEDIQDEILDYVMEYLTVNDDGQLFIDHHGVQHKKCLLYAEDLVFNGRKGHRVRIIMQGSDKIYIDVLGEGDEEDSAKPIQLNQKETAWFMTFIDVEKNTIDSDAVISSIYVSDGGVPSFSPDLKRPLIDVEVETADNTTLQAIVTQRGDGLEFRVSEQGVRINFRRVLYPISWRNTGYTRINELTIDEVKALANVCCQTLARNKMKGKLGEERMIVQWDLGLEIDKVMKEEGKAVANVETASSEIERRESFAFYNKTQAVSKGNLTRMTVDTRKGKLI
ncbi:hypothetical protein TrVE_jg11562 [Triparma verrucosa]|uniref:Uncharacterized protein n=1 Tax=Triparma verrucosa TaxID=1606542 RepID=A0A9W7BN61_9STRA|nr:hypothetical protein TrVE_jg11562 [Triparma verrucosa]